MRRDLETVDSHDMLEQAVQVLHRCGCRSLPVQHNGELVGMLALENVGEFMMIRSAMRRALRDKGQPSHGLSWVRAPCRTIAKRRRKVVKVKG